MTFAAVKKETVRAVLGRFRRRCKDDLQAAALPDDGQHFLVGHPHTGGGEDPARKVQRKGR